MMLYADLLPEEEAVLKPMESAVIQTLLAKSVTARPLWTSSSESGVRTVQLVLPDEPAARVLLTLALEEVATISQNELIARLNQGLT
jgi:hypothetical protein